jgi:RHS repeat-associated protein
VIDPTVNASGTTDCGIVSSSSTAACSNATIDVGSSGATSRMLVDFTNLHYDISRSGGSTLNLGYADISSTERTSAGTSTYATSILGLDQAVVSGNTYTYVHDVTGNLVARLTSSSRHYYLTDGLGSIIKLIDTGGGVINEYRYDPWGNTTTVTKGVYNPYQYAGGYTEPSGLLKFGTRYYNPNLARWTQRDPSGQDQNAYACVADNPVQCHRSNRPLLRRG